MALPQGFGPRRSFADVQRQQLANQLLAQGGDASPVQHEMQGVARLAQALMGGYLTNRNETRENEAQQAFSRGITEAMAPQMVQGAAGPGPRSGPQGATMAPPSMAEVAQRLGANPATAHLAPQFQMMDLQQQAAEAAKRNDPMFGRVAVRGVGLVDMRGNAPQVVVPEQRPQNQPRFSVHNIGGRAVAIDQSDPTRRNDLGPYGSPAAQAPAGTQPAFPGTGMSQQIASILLDPNIPPTDPRYHFAFEQASAPQERYDPATGQMIITRPNLPPSIRRPVYQDQPPVAPPAMPPAPQPTPGEPPPVGALAPAQQLTPNTSIQQVTPGRPQPLTETQGKAGGFADRMAASDLVIQRLGHVGTSAQDRLLARIPGAGNYLVSGDYQQFDQARRDFINAVLRRESGAVISPEEFANAEVQYFPQPGDNPQTIAQKARNRRTTLDAIAREAGPSYRLPGADAPASDPPRPPRVEIPPEAEAALRRLGL